MIETLIAGCGPHYKRRSTHKETLLDLRDFPGIDVVADLESRWPFPEASFDEVVALHVVEHLRDLVHFMDEAWRVLRPGGALYLETPEAGGDLDLTHADPTHVRCFRKHTFINYFIPSEAPKFGYTKNHWAVLDLRVEAGNIRLHASPIKPCPKPREFDALTDARVRGIEAVEDLFKAFPALSDPSVTSDYAGLADACKALLDRFRDLGLVD